jgi:hypothetical protein
MSTWYQGAQEEIGLSVPAQFKPLYRGVNTGVMFMVFPFFNILKDLELMRNKDWSKIWIDELNSQRHSQDDYLRVSLKSNLPAS